MKRDSETAFALGSATTVVGFWGLVIDGALRYAVNEPVAGAASFFSDPDLWLFGALFACGLVVMGLAAVVGRRRTLGSPTRA